VKHEVLHVELVDAPDASALLLLQPDFFFGDVGELVEGRQPAMAGRMESHYRPLQQE
jgi:hypothetical protein